MNQPVQYPSYKSLDSLIGVDRLRSLDGYITERLLRRIEESRRDTAFYTGPFQLGDSGSRVPGSRMVYLSRSKGQDNYYELDDPARWEISEEAAEFSLLMDFIETLPFKATGRMLIIYDDSGRAVTAHRDHDSPDLCHEFIWFRTNFAKPFYMLNVETSQKLYVQSHTAWFDTVNQYHGADASDGLSFSIRVDGIFADDVRKQIPFASANRSAAPSVWAALED
jgi:hypothetical protein